MSPKPTTHRALTHGEAVVVSATSPVGRPYPQVTLHAGVLDAAAYATYLGGQCVALALALSEQSGWPVVFLGSQLCNQERGDWSWNDPCQDYPDDLCRCQVEHFGVLTPQGDFVDIKGAAPLGQVLSAYHYDQLFMASPALLAAMARDHRHWPPREPSAAHSFATTLLAQLTNRGGGL